MSIQDTEFYEQRSNSSKDVSTHLKEPQNFVSLSRFRFIIFHVWLKHSKDVGSCQADLIFLF